MAISRKKGRKEKNADRRKYIRERWKTKRKNKKYKEIRKSR